VEWKITATDVCAWLDVYVNSNSSRMFTSGALIAGQYASFHIFLLLFDATRTFAYTNIYSVGALCLKEFCCTYGEFCIQSRNRFLRAQTAIVVGVRRTQDTPQVLFRFLIGFAYSGVIWIVTIADFERPVLYHCVICGRGSCAGQGTAVRCCKCWQGAEKEKSASGRDQSEKSTKPDGSHVKSIPRAACGGARYQRARACAAGRGR
jgi:hypothetical protein